MVKNKMLKMVRLQIFKIHIQKILQLTQVLLFTQRLLFLVDEKHSSFSLNADKRILPHFLLINQEDAKKNIQFFISYQGGQIGKSLKGEELIFYLNLYSEKDV